eukprot:Lithocolla_globosa_v1_NODE_1924_length_2258_cov_3.798003.p1 type:complete len:586 gc:universal NODE_1924_length_2258_cov_3.798003:391-2148(+)
MKSSPQSHIDYALGYSQPTQMSPFNALVNLIRCGKSKQSYQIDRQDAIEQGFDMFPAMNHVREEKKNHIPTSQSEGVLKLDAVVTAESAVVPLQSLLDHTAKSFFESEHFSVPPLPLLECDDAGNFFKAPAHRTLILEGAIGWDSSTNQKLRKHKPGKEETAGSGEPLFTLYNDDGSPSEQLSQRKVDMKSLMAIPYKPLRMTEQYDADVFADDRDFICWSTPAPNSPQFCRPHSLSFEKECVQGSREIYSRLKEDIDSLKSTVFKKGNQMFKVSHKVYCTMLDGKVSSAVHGVGTNTCAVCGSTEKHMNDLDYLLSLPIKNEALLTSIPAMHLWIRSLEYLWHVAIRLTIRDEKGNYVYKRYQDEHKTETERLRRELQQTIKQRTGQLMDFPNPGGSGTTTDGNCARALMGSPVVLAEILGMDEELIERLGVCCSALSSGLQLDSAKVQVYFITTYKRAVDKYPWYPLPASVHAALLHTYRLILYFPLPITYLTEEAGETCNRIYRYLLEWHCRKDTKLHSMTDLLTGRLVATAPKVVLEIFHKNKKFSKADSKTTSLPAAVIALAKCEHVTVHSGCAGSLKST